jgi:hypothetical protein
MSFSLFPHRPPDRGRPRRIARSERRVSICCYTCSRTRAHAAAILSSLDGVISSNTRHTVVSEVTDPEQLSLMAQRIDLTNRRAAIGDHHRQVGQHPIPIMHRPDPGPNQRPGQCARQPHPVSRQPQQSRPDVRHDTMPTHFQRQVPGPRSNIHLKSASPARRNKDLKRSLFSQLRGTFAYQKTRPLKIIFGLGEWSRLTAAEETQLSHPTDTWWQNRPALIRGRLGDRRDAIHSLVDERVAREGR